MPKTRVPSPARSQGGVTTPKRKNTRGSRSLCSPALSTASGRLTSLIDQFKDKNMESFALSPLNGRSVLNDNTEIEEPRRKSWWRKLDENSQDVMEVLEDNKLTDVNNVIEEFIDIEVLSQEKKNYTLDLPESSDNESINSIVLPQRKLFTQKENQPQKKFGQFVGNRESLAKLHKANTTNIEKTVNVGTRELFQNTKRSKPIFPAALLNISPNKTTADKTKENVLVEPKPQVRNIFGNRPANKRKNMFADFIVSESEDEIPDIQPKVFGFQRKLEQQRFSSVSKGREGSPTSSITTDMEMDDWKLLPSSTMVENQLEDMVAGNTPIKRARLSKLSEAKESDVGTNTLQTNTTGDKTKQSNKSVSSKNKSKASPEIKDKTLDNSRTTRSMLKNASKCEENVNTSIKQDAKINKSQSKISAKGNELDDVSPAQSEDEDKQNTTLNKSKKQNRSKTSNSPKALKNEIISDENIVSAVNAINNVTRVINKSTAKNLSSSTVANKTLNDKERTVTVKVHNKENKSNSNDVDQNEQEDDENNFTLEYENEDNEVVEEAVVHNDFEEKQKDNIIKDKTNVLEKENQQTEINKSKSNRSSFTNKSINKETKAAKIVEESVESQNEQFSADDNVDGLNQDNQNEEKATQDIDEGVNNSREDENEGNISVANEEVNELEVSQKNEDEANETEDNDNEVNVSQENADEHNESQEEANQSQEVENEVNESREDDDANDSDENENEADVNEDDANASQDVEAPVSEDECNESQNVEADVSEDETNESQEVEADINESREIDEEAQESQEIDENAHESQIVEDNEAPDEENDEEMNEDEEEAGNETTVNESQEVENNEESQEVESKAEVNESEDDQQMEDSDEADKAIASDPEISDQDDNQADEMEVDDDNENEQESENEDQSVQNQHESHEERQIEVQNDVEPSAEDIEESPNVTHDTTGRHRKKNLNKSPEVILKNETNLMDSFTAKGRNTSVRKTKSMINNQNIRPSLAPPRDSTGFNDGTTNSSAEGSGWDSHRTTRKTLRQTFGKDFTPRKSLRALVMEKSAKRQTVHVDIHSETVKYPQANSTELPEYSNHHVEDIVESDHEVSRRTRQTTLEMYLQKIRQQNIEKKHKMEEAVRNSLKGPVRDTLSLFKVPNKPAPRRPKPSQSKPKKQMKSIIPFDELPSEVIEDMKYKPPKRFQPTNASWITKRLYKFLENKLEPKYDYKARIRAEKLVETIYHFAKDLRRHDVAPTDAVEVLKHELARLDVVHTHFEFYEFFHEFMPREVRVKVVPDIVNKIPLPRHGVFSDILRGNTVQG